MIILYGDSHVDYSFKNLSIIHRNYSTPSVTMYRIGRDKVIPRHISQPVIGIYKFRRRPIFCFGYGEVDCRCHIGKQVVLGRNEDDIINELTSAYIDTIKRVVTSYEKIIIVGVIPPRCQEEYKNEHGQITHEFPFVGTDIERLRYTNKVNERLKTLCQLNKFQYFNGYDYCTRSDGYLDGRYSDQVHLKDNAVFLQRFLSVL